MDLDGDEIGDQIDGGCEPEARQAEDDLRVQRHARVAEQAPKEADEIRQEQRELPRQKRAAREIESDDEDSPDDDRRDEERDPAGKIHYTLIARSASDVGMDPVVVIASWNARSAGRSAAPRFASHRVRMSTISSIPVK